MLADLSPKPYSGAILEGSQEVPADPAESDVGYWWEMPVVEGPDELPLVKPPYSRITAIDLDTGEHVWMTPFGDGPRNHPRLAHLDLPPLGWGLRGAPLLTDELLFIGHEGGIFAHFKPLLDGSLLDDPTDENIAHFQPKFYAFDKRNGARPGTRSWWRSRWSERLLHLIGP